MIASRENKAITYPYIEDKSNKIEQKVANTIASLVEGNGQIDRKINDRMRKSGLFHIIATTFFREERNTRDFGTTKVIRKLVRLTITYSGESWTPVDKHKTRLDVMEMKCIEN